MKFIQSDCSIFIRIYLDSGDDYCRGGEGRGGDEIRSIQHGGVDEASGIDLPKIPFLIPSQIAQNLIVCSIQVSCHITIIL